MTSKRSKTTLREVAGASEERSKRNQNDTASINGEIIIIAHKRIDPETQQVAQVSFRTMKK